MSKVNVGIEISDTEEFRMTFDTENFGTAEISSRIESILDSIEDIELAVVYR